jgi:hypothetical protein
MHDNDSIVVPGVLGTSAVIIIWWVSLWLIIEETIAYVSGDKRHIKLAVCTLIIIILTIYAHIQPTFARKL